MGVVNLKNEKDHFLTLGKIMQQVSAIIDTYLPDELAIEAPFYGKNPQVMLKLGRAQGAAIAAALLKQIPIFEYAPRSIKLAVTGKGAASKQQVANMAQNQLKINIEQDYLDATDALAIALCHYYHSSSPLAAFTACSIKPKKSKSSSSWENFVSCNDERVIKNKK